MSSILTLGSIAIGMTISSSGKGVIRVGPVPSRTLSSREGCSKQRQGNGRRAPGARKAAAAEAAESRGWTYKPERALMKLVLGAPTPVRLSYPLVSRSGC